MKLLNILFYNFWPKVICLILAVATWFYVFDLVNTESFIQKSETARDVFSRYEFTLKDVPVKPAFAGKSPEGYRVVFEGVKITPGNVSVLCPVDVAENLTELRTDSINLGEYTRPTTLRLGLRSDIKALKLDEKVVEVYVPVVKVE